MLNTVATLLCIIVASAAIGQPNTVVFDETLQLKEFEQGEISGYLEPTIPMEPTRFNDGFSSQYDAFETVKEKRAFLIDELDRSYKAAGSLSLDEFIENHQEKLKVIPTKVPNFGVTENPMFYHLKVQNKGPRQEIVLQFHGIIKDARIVIDREGQRSKFSTGLLYPFDTLLFDDYVKAIAIPLELEAGESASLYMKVAAFGVPTSMPVRLFSKRAYEKDIQKRYVINALFLGTLLSLTIYNLFLFLTTRDRVYLYYSTYLIGTVSLAINMEGMGPFFRPSDYYLYYGPFHGCLSIWVCVTGILMFSRTYLNLKTHSPLMKKGTDILLIIAILNGLAIPVTPLSFQITSMAFVMGSIMIYMLAASIRLAFRRVRESWFYVTAFLMFMIAVMTTILASQGFIDASISEHNIKIGVFLQMMLLSLGTGDKISSLADDLSAVNLKLKGYIKNVENLVEMKVKNIRSIFSHISVGIFTINREFKIEKDYSQALLTILNSDLDLAGQNPVEAVFSASNLSKEEVSRLQLALFCAIGEKHFIWELNQSCLVKEMTMMVDGKLKILEVDFDPIVHDDKVQQVVVTIRDATVARQRQEKELKQQKELELMHRLSEMKEGDYHLFRTEVDERTRDIAALLSKQNEDREKIINGIFIHLHTLKTHARSLNFRDLSGQLHQAEEYYSRIKAGKESWNSTVGENHITSLHSSIGHLDEIFYEKLHRSNIPIIKISEPEISNALTKLDDDQWLKYLQDGTIAVVMKPVFEHLYKGSSKFLQDLLWEGTQMAQDLGKKVPRFEISGSEVRFSQEGCRLLKDVLGHLIGNSLDHGIEDEHDRKARKKPTQGTLTVHLIEGSDHLVLEVYDDGRGLDLQKIRETAQLKGLIKDPKNLPPQELANLIFEPGFTTRNQVTEFSGRGVGMDAVRSMIEAAGGMAKIQLAQPDEAGFCAFRFEIQLPRNLYRKVPAPIALNSKMTTGTVA